MKKKILAICVVSIFLLLGFSSLSVVGKEAGFDEKSVTNEDKDIVEIKPIFDNLPVFIFKAKISGELYTGSKEVITRFNRNKDCYLLGEIESSVFGIRKHVLGNEYRAFFMFGFAKWDKYEYQPGTNCIFDVEGTVYGLFFIKFKFNLD